MNVEREVLDRLDRHDAFVNDPHRYGHPQDEHGGHAGPGGHAGH
jgi:hypothetical protein